VKTNSGTHRRKGVLARLRKDQAGNVIAVMAAALIPLVGIVGGALDMSRIYLTNSKLQTACDAGVLAARQQASGALTADNRTRGQQFFRFNFPTGTMGSSAATTSFTLTPNAANTQRVDGVATTRIPATLMRVFGQEDFDVTVNCDAERDIGHNDIMIVLDVTGSMLCTTGDGCAEGQAAARRSGNVISDTTSAAIPAASKLATLRAGIPGLYTALQSTDPNIVTRFGIVPYSMTVNVGHLLNNVHLKQTTRYTHRFNNRYFMTNVDIQTTGWRTGTGDAESTLNNWRNQADNSTCVEERQSIGRNDRRVSTSVTQADIDTFATTRTETDLQFGLYMYPPRNSAGNPLINQWNSSNQTMQVACPARARPLQVYPTLGDFNTAITAATARATGGTLHDTGMIWGARLLSPTGFRSANNPTTRNDAAGTAFPVNRHIVFMTDGILGTSGEGYDMYGHYVSEGRLAGTGSVIQRHQTRFQNICSLARSQGVTIWVIAYDVANTADIATCATSTGHFFTANNSNLQTVFSNIGRGIGDLRLAR
jgi:Flp pilus assembly protein TadG